MANAWLNLWETIKDDDNSPVSILTNPFTPNIVYVTWSDQSTATLKFDNSDGEWYFSTESNISPCDIAARDTL